jgi:hypothetical protein
LEWLRGPVSPVWAYCIGQSVYTRAIYKNSSRIPPRGYLYLLVTYRRKVNMLREVLPTPAASATGPVCQATISITGSVPNPPLDGMAASIELSR